MRQVEQAEQRTGRLGSPIGAGFKEAAAGAAEWRRRTPEISRRQPAAAG